MRYLRNLALCILIWSPFLPHASWGAPLPPIRSYTDAGAPIDYKAIHLNRKSVTASGGASRYLNEWDTAESVERISSSGRWYWRESLTMPPGTHYLEAFIWDAAGRNSYLGYASLAGDITGTGARCSSQDVTDCAYVAAEGQLWVPNVSASDGQALVNSPAMVAFDSSTTGFGRGHRYYDKSGAPQALFHYVLAGQIWARETFTRETLLAYADNTNTAESYGWEDPGNTRLPNVTIAPESAYILRQYSDCHAPISGNVNARDTSFESVVSKTPWRVCKLFEDHIYGMSQGKAMGEIGAVFGFTPGAFGWADDKWAVIHVMIMTARISG